VDDCCAERDAALAELAQAREENIILRGLAALEKPCHYCGAETMAKCPTGFPGCALADDLLVADEEATRRFGDRLGAAVARAERAEREIEESQARETAALAALDVALDENGRLALEAATADRDWKRAEARAERLQQSLAALWDHLHPEPKMDGACVVRRHRIPAELYGQVLAAVGGGHDRPESARNNADAGDES
jgi:hypothetical protein